MFTAFQRKVPAAWLTGYDFASSFDIKRYAPDILFSGKAFDKI